MKHFSIKQDNPTLVYQLITEVWVIDPRNSANRTKANALWDTGASGSVITPGVFSNLHLIPFDKTMVGGVNNQSEADVVKIDVDLPNMDLIKNIDAAVCDMDGVDMLIGMDIITLGDFAICNARNETLFTFAIPPFDDKIDLFEKSRETH
jgi:hypothetical protein